WHGTTVTAIASSTGQKVVATDAQTVPPLDADAVFSGRDRTPGGDRVVRERVHGLEFEVRATGFWQVHPQAAEVLVDAVLDAADVHAGDRIVDLYAGAGLFSAFLARAVG